MTVGERIKHRRQELGLNVDEVAEQLGKNRATVYRYESNEIENLPAKVLSPLAEVLETTPAYLMGWTEDPYDYDRDPNGLMDNVPSSWLAAWREEGVSNAEIWKRYALVSEDDKKTPSTLIDTEGLSEDKRKLVDYVMSLSEEEVRLLRRMFDISQTGK